MLFEILNNQKSQKDLEWIKQRKKSNLNRYKKSQKNIQEKKTYTRKDTGLTPEEFFTKSILFL